MVDRYERILGGLFGVACGDARSSPNYCVNSPLIDNMDLMT